MSIHCTIFLKTYIPPDRNFQWYFGAFDRTPFSIDYASKHVTVQNIKDCNKLYILCQFTAYMQIFELPVQNLECPIKSTFYI